MSLLTSCSSSIVCGSYKYANKHICKFLHICKSIRSQTANVYTKNLRHLSNNNTSSIEKIVKNLRIRQKYYNATLVLSLEIVTNLVFYDFGTCLNLWWASFILLKSSDARCISKNSVSSLSVETTQVRNFILWLSLTFSDICSKFKICWT